jgi:hypothetical protein
MKKLIILALLLGACSQKSYESYKAKRHRQNHEYCCGGKVRSIQMGNTTLVEPVRKCN